MQPITKDPSETPKDYIVRIAKRVQDESICFGCSSALFGLTKLLYDLEQEAYINQSWNSICEKAFAVKDSGCTVDAEEINQTIQELQKPRLKFFYIKFYDTPHQEWTSNHTCTEHLGARIYFPDTFASERFVSIESGDDVYFISIPEVLMDIIRSGGDAWSNERVAAKKEQMRLTAHEMAHQLFRHIYPEDNYGLITEENIELFADEILEYRKNYRDGVPISLEPE